MRNNNTRCKCSRRKLSKCKDICKTYSSIQYEYANILEKEKNIKEFICNFVLSDISLTAHYTTDFLCTKTNGDKFVRECVYKKHLTKPLTIKLLDLSRNYWIKRGIEWGIVTDED